MVYFYIFCYHQYYFLLVFIIMLHILILSVFKRFSIFVVQLSLQRLFLIYRDGFVAVFISWCYDCLSAYQSLYLHQKFCFHGNFTGPKMTPCFDSSTTFHSNGVGELPFLHRNHCRSGSRGSGTIIRQKIWQYQNLLTDIFLGFPRKRAP